MDDAFEKAYREYYTPVYRYTLSICKNEHEAEEITQETFFKALKNIEKYDPSQRMLTWLCAIAKNTCLSRVKKAGRFTELPEELVDTGDSILDRIIDSESSTEVLKALHVLPEPFKEVFTLRVLGAFSFKKIGDVFGRTESWARVTFFRSKTMIKELMENG